MAASVKFLPCCWSPAFTTNAVCRKSDIEYDIFDKCVCNSLCFSVIFLTFLDKTLRHFDTRLYIGVSYCRRVRTLVNHHHY